MLKICELRFGSEWLPVDLNLPHLKSATQIKKYFPNALLMKALPSGNYLIVGREYRTDNLVYYQMVQRPDSQFIVVYELVPC